MKFYLIEKNIPFFNKWLNKIIQDHHNEKISLLLSTTLYSFKKGYLKEINIGNEMSYFDTNTHLTIIFMMNTKELTDISTNDVSIKKNPTPPNGKKIESVEVTFKISKNI